jgi:hypothetical protein
MPKEIVGSSTFPLAPAPRLKLPFQRPHLFPETGSLIPQGPHGIEIRSVGPEEVRTFDSAGVPNTVPVWAETIGEARSSLSVNEWFSVLDFDLRLHRIDRPFTYTTRVVNHGPDLATNVWVTVLVMEVVPRAEGFITNNATNLAPPIVWQYLGGIPREIVSSNWQYRIPLGNTNRFLQTARGKHHHRRPEEGRGGMDLVDRAW